MCIFSCLLHVITISRVDTQTRNFRWGKIDVSEIISKIYKIVIILMYLQYKYKLRIEFYIRIMMIFIDCQFNMNFMNRSRTNAHVY